MSTVEKIEGQLADRDAGWVTRRDAAEALGQRASQAVEVLRRFEDDSDRDVRSAVLGCLGWVRSAVEGIRPVARDKTYSLAELANSLDKKGSREVSRHGDGFKVHVSLKNERRQEVFITPVDRSDGESLVRVYTHCGKPTPDSHMWALRNNMMLAQCALAITEHEGEDMFVLVAGLITDHISPLELKAAVKEIAFFGDWIEEKLTGLDEF